MRRVRARLIAIDGVPGVGKSTLAETMAKRLKTRPVQLDRFLSRRRDGYVRYINRYRLERSLRGLRTAVVEGVCVLKVLRSVGREPDALIYIKRFSSGRWADEQDFVPTGSLDGHLAAIQAEADAWSGALGGHFNRSLKEEVIRYHVEFNPHHEATHVYVRADT